MESIIDLKAAILHRIGARTAALPKALVNIRIVRGSSVLITGMAKTARDGGWEWRSAAGLHSIRLGAEAADNWSVEGALRSMLPPQKERTRATRDQTCLPRRSRQAGIEGRGDRTIFKPKPGACMDAGFSVTYHEYTISIVEADRRFTAVVTRPGALIQHDGHASERWSSASCGSFDRALVVAKKAIDGDVIR